MTISEIELAWAAGLFEGEGTVTITGVGGDRPFTRIRVAVSSTDIDVVNFFQERWPIGKLYTWRPSNSKNAKNATMWYLSCKRAGLFLSEILPYIRTPRVRKKIELALEAQSLRRFGTHVGTDYKSKQFELMAKMRELNKRGT